MPRDKAERHLGEAVPRTRKIMTVVLRVIHTMHQAMTHHRLYQIPLRRRKPAPTAKVDPGLRRESGGVELNQLNGSVH